MDTNKFKVARRSCGFFCPPSFILKTHETTEATVKIAENAAKVPENEPESKERGSKNVLIDGKEPEKRTIP